VNDNPWHRLPKQPPYVLDEDKKDIHTFNLKLDLDLIPEPFVGHPDAPVIILGNNPGVNSVESAALRREPAFANRMRENLLHQFSADFPFLYFDPKITSTGKDWWERKLKSLFREFGNGDIARPILARSILAVEFFPYVSHRFPRRRPSLPSQQYSFSLVRNAMGRGAVIILTRGQRWWEEAVEKLRDYPRCFRLKEVQRAPISPGNLPHPEQYQEIVQAIKQNLPDLTSQAAVTHTSPTAD